MSQPRAPAASAIWLLLVPHPLQGEPARPIPAAEPEAAPQDAIPGPAIGQAAPGFELASASAPERRLPLEAWLDGRALALVFGSSTSVPLAAAAERLNELALVYGEEVAFLFVYLREAETSERPETLAERRGRCAETASALGFPFPAVVDELDDRVGAAYAAYPERLFLIAPDGRVAFAGAPGLDPDALELAILEKLTAAAPPMKPGAHDAPEPPERRHAEAGLLAALDVDGDGALSPAEIDGASAVLRGFDLDGDGTLIGTELRRAIGPDRPPPSAPPASSAETPPEDAAAPAVGRGAVGGAEAPSPPAEPADALEREPAEGRIESYDYDRDGRLSRIEVPRAMLERWETFDRNGDGYLDAAEQAPLGAREREPRDG